MTHPYTDLKEALAKATLGEWRSVGDCVKVDRFPPVTFPKAADFDFIALARNRLPELLADYERMREALEGLLNRYDPENPGDAMAPDGGCIECTVGTVPNNLNTGLCPMHRARAALKEKPHD